MIRCRVVARGRVQGVFFRASTRDRALAEGVRGWVANRADGAVEAVLEGEERAVERLLHFMREGPGHSSVDSLEVTEEAPVGEETFQIR